MSVNFMDELDPPEVVDFTKTVEAPPAPEPVDFEKDFEYAPGFAVKGRTLSVERAAEAPRALTLAVREGRISEEEARTFLTNRQPWGARNAGDAPRNRYVKTGHAPTSGADFNLEKEFSFEGESGDFPDAFSLSDESFHRNSSWHEDPVKMASTGIRLASLPVAAGLMATGVGTLPALGILGGVGAGSEFGAQALEKSEGMRDSYAPGAIAVSGGLGLLPLPRLSPGVGTNFLKTAATRSAQGAVIGGAGSVTRQLIDNGEVSVGEAGLETLLGGLFGAGMAPLETALARAGAVRMARNGGLDVNSWQELEAAGVNHFRKYGFEGKSMEDLRKWMRSDAGRAAMARRAEGATEVRSEKLEVSSRAERSRPAGGGGDVAPAAGGAAPGGAPVVPGGGVPAAGARAVGGGNDMPPGGVPEEGVPRNYWEGETPSERVVVDDAGEPPVDFTQPVDLPEGAVEYADGMRGGAFDPSDANVYRDASPAARGGVRVSPTLAEDVHAAVNVDASSGTVLKSSAIVRFSGTPDVFKLLGVPDADFVSTVSRLRKMKNEHGLTEDQISDFPNQYARPVAVFKDQGSFLVLTDQVAPNREGVLKPVFVVLRPQDEKQNVFIASAYSPERTKELHLANFAKKSLVYLDETRAADLNLKAETQFSLETLKPSSGSVKGPQDLGNVAQGQGNSGLFFGDAKRGYADVELRGAEGFSPVQMPELVSIARQLGVAVRAGNLRGGTRGVFRPKGGGEIVISRALFDDPVAAAKTIAHELGHAVDWFGTPGTAEHKAMNRGNLLGRLGTLKEFTKTTLPKLSGDAAMAKVMTPADRAALRRAATQETVEALGGRPSRAEDVDGWLAWGEELGMRYAAKVEAEIEARGLAKLDTVRSELRELTQWWKPFDEARAPAAYRDYRYSSPELYADAVSVLFNSPEALRTRAPVFWELFWNHAEKKPEVIKAVRDVQDLITAGPEALSRRRGENLRRGFERGRDAFLQQHAERMEPVPLREMLRGAVQQYWNKFRPIIRRGEQLTKAGVAHDIDFFFDEHPMGDSKGALWLSDFDSAVRRPLEESGLRLDDLAEYLFYDRVGNESPELARPKGHTPETARTEMRNLLRLHGDARSRALVEAAAESRRLFDKAVNIGVESGLFSAEQVAQWRAENAPYAPFLALDHFEKDARVSAGFAKVKGNLGDVVSPVEAQVMKGLAIIRAAQLNGAKRKVGEIMQAYFPDEVGAAEMVRDGRGRPAGFKRPRDPKKTGLLEWKADGKAQGLYVPKEIERMFDGQSASRLEAVSTALNSLFKSVFYPAFISLNPEFLLWTGPMRDIERALVNTPTWGGKANVVWEFARNYASKIAGLPLSDNARVIKNFLHGDFSDPLIREMLEHGSIVRPHELFTKSGATRTQFKGDETDVLETLMAQYRLLPTALEKRNFWNAKVKPALGKVIAPIQYAGQSFEALGKVAPYRYLREELGWDARSAAYYVRNYAGIPNTSRAGTNIRIAKAAFPFVDVAGRAVGADFGELATGRSPLYGRNLKGMYADKSKGAKAAAVAGRAGVKVASHFVKYLWRYLAGIGGVLLLQKIFEEGLAGDEMKRMYDHIPEHEKANKAVIPLGWRGVPGVDAEVAYLAVPLDEQVGLINSLVRTVITAVRRGDVGKAANEITTVGRGNFPGLTPVLQIGANFLEYASGENPQDNFRNRPIISSAAQEARPVDAWPAMKDMGAWAMGQTGYPNLIPFKYNSEAKDTADALVKGLPFVRRAIKFSDRGLLEKQLEAQDIIDAKEARVRANLQGTEVDRLLREKSLITSLERMSVRTLDQEQRVMALNLWYSNIYTPYRTMLLQAYEANDKKAVARLEKELVELSKGFAR